MPGRIGSIIRAAAPYYSIGSLYVFLSESWPSLRLLDIRMIGRGGVDIDAPEEKEYSLLET